MHKLDCNHSSDAAETVAGIGTPLVAQLGTHHRERVEEHLLRLSEEDRWLRFGHQISDDSIGRYSRSIHFYRDAAFGAFDETGAFLGFGHLALGESEAEFAVSVERAARGRGVGRALLARAAEHARNRGHRVLTMVYMPENSALAALARSAGMHRICESTECRAHLGLDPGTAESLLSEAWREAIASIDLGLRLGRQPQLATSA